MICQGKEEKEKAELRHDSVLAGAETRFVPPESMQEAGQCILLCAGRAIPDKQVDLPSFLPRSSASCSPLGLALTDS